MSKLQNLKPNGFSLPVTLSLILTLAVILSVAVFYSRQSYESVRAATKREQDRQQLLGALRVVEYSMRANPEKWNLANHAHSFRIGETNFKVGVQASAGLIDLNAAMLGSLQDMLIVAGADIQKASDYANRIIDWRDPDKVKTNGYSENSDYENLGIPLPRNGSFKKTEELALVLGFGPVTAKCLQPLITVDSSLAEIVSTLAPPPLRSNGRDTSNTPITPSIGSAVEITISDVSKAKPTTLVAVVRMTDDPRNPQITHELIWKPAVARNIAPDCFP